MRSLAVRSANAAEPDIDRLNEWVPDTQEIPDYLLEVRQLLTETSDRVLAKSNLAPEYRQLYRQIVFATGNGLCYGFEPVDPTVKVAPDKWITQSLRGPIVYYIDVEKKDTAEYKYTHFHPSDTAGVLQVLPGPGGAMGESLVRHPLVRKISFTGSTEVGRRIMEQAALRGYELRPLRDRRSARRGRRRRCRRSVRRGAAE